MQYAVPISWGTAFQVHYPVTTPDAFVSCKMESSTVFGSYFLLFMSQLQSYNHLYLKGMIPLVIL